MKIAIIGAMEEEVQVLRNEITEQNVFTSANCEFTTGKIQGKEVVLLKSGIGKVNAAMATTILMEKFQPDVIINTGSAGGLNPELTVGDLVISTEVRHHDVDATAFDYEYGQVPQMPAAFYADEKMITLAEECAKDILNVKTVKGLIASGDSFMSDPSRVKMVGENFKNVQAVEMEAAAIAQVAYQYQVPFVIIRALSDIAGQESAVSFDQFIHTAAKNSSMLILRMLEKL